MNGSLKNKWLEVSPTSGINGGSLSISGTEHTGRAVRLFSLKVKTVADDGQGSVEPEEPIVCTVTGRQEAAAMFLNLTSGTPDSSGSDDDLTDGKIVVSKTAHTITLKGRSNAQKLAIATEAVAGEGDGLSVTFGDLTITPSVTDNEGTTGSALTIASGAAIAGDPGLYGAYDFEVVFNIPANLNTFNESATVTVTASAEATAAIDGEIEATTAATDIVKSFTIEQLSGDAYLYVGAEGQSTTMVTIPADGTAQTVAVISNVSWTVTNDGAEA